MPGKRLLASVTAAVAALGVAGVVAAVESPAGAAAAYSVTSLHFGVL